jgi:beta-lactamase superfamily II metal-dependent hydrolase
MRDPRPQKENQTLEFGTQDERDFSVVVRVDVEGLRLQFPGDIEQGAEAALVARLADLL